MADQARPDPPRRTDPATRAATPDAGTPEGPSDAEPPEGLQRRILAAADGATDNTDNTDNTDKTDFGDSGDVTPLPQRASTPVAFGSFDVAADSTVVHTVGSVPRAAAYSAFAVSLEPGNTPPATPSDVLATGEVDS